MIKDGLADMVQKLLKKAYDKVLDEPVPQDWLDKLK